MSNTETAKVPAGTQVMAVVGGNVIAAVVDEDLGGGKFRIHRAGGAKVFTCGKVSLPRQIPAPAETKPAEAGKKASGPAVKKPSLTAAAAAILADGGARSVKELVAEAKERGLWTPGKGSTPEQTLYSAIFREIRASAHPRFRKSAEKGKFEANA